MKQNKKGLTPKKQDPRWKLTRYKSLADWDESFYEKPWKVNLVRSKKIAKKRKVINRGNYLTMGSQYWQGFNCS